MSIEKKKNKDCFWQIYSVRIFRVPDSEWLNVAECGRSSYITVSFAFPVLWGADLDGLLVCLSHSKQRACGHRKLALCVCEDNVCRLVTFLRGLPRQTPKQTHHYRSVWLWNRTVDLWAASRCTKERANCQGERNIEEKQRKGGCWTNKMAAFSYTVLSFSRTRLIIITYYNYNTDLLYTTRLSSWHFSIFQTKSPLLLVHWFHSALHFLITANATSPVARPTGYCVTCNVSCCISRVWKEFVEARIIYTDLDLM